MSFFDFGNSENIIRENVKRIKKAMKRAKKKAKNAGYPKNGTMIKVIPKPEKYRAKIDETWNLDIDSDPVKLVINAIGLDSHQDLDVEVWKTNSVGINKDLGSGKIVEVTYKPDSNGRTRLKVSTSGNEDTVVIYREIN